MKRKTIQILAFLMALSAPVFGQIKVEPRDWQLGVCEEHAGRRMVRGLDGYAFECAEIWAQDGDSVIYETKFGRPVFAVWVGWAMPADVQQARRAAGQNTTKQ